MSEIKKSGRAFLRPVDSKPFAGTCSYSVGAKGFEAKFALQMPGEADAKAVLQLGAEHGYACEPPVPAAGMAKCVNTGVAAVWVLDGTGKPALFATIGTGPFDRAQALRTLLERKAKPDTTPGTVRVASVPVSVAAPPSTAVRPSYREPPAGEPGPPFLLREPQSGAAAAAEGGAAPSGAQTDPVETASPTANQAVRIMSAPEPAQRPAWQDRVPPLVVKRAPRPTPHPPVYSPLWDDVSVEFEKMLDSLPRSQPFNGSAEDAVIAEVPTGGAVQCYIGSVMAGGVKVFLQAVPARPYARPAGFDHSLVSRNGECFWVKYFIQNS